MVPLSVLETSAPSISRPSGWHVGVLGRADQGASKPGPASRATASASGIPERGASGRPSAPRAAPRPAHGPPARGSPPEPF